MKKLKTNIDLLLGKPFYKYEKFHEITKFKQFYKTLPVEKWPIEWKTTYFKEYPRLDKIILPAPSTIDSISLSKALYRRHSQRNFSKKGLSIQDINNLLYYSAGLRIHKPPWLGNRFYPSPGGRYTLETYVISQNSDLPTGVYHYNLKDHTLETLLMLNKFSYKDYFDQPWIAKASCIILFTTVFLRNTIKYSDRGYRHIMQEAGHLGQNFYLNAAAFDIAICGIGGYIDNNLNTLLDIDPAKETVIYALAIGKH